MKVLFQKIKAGFKKVKNAVKKEPLEFIASCTPIIMCVLSLITGLVLWLVFVVKGGYSEQISLIKSGDFMGAFTYGNVKILYNPIGYINIALSVISVLTTIIIFIKKEKLVKRIIFIVDMVISIVSMSLVTSVIMYDSWLQDNDRKKYEEWSLKLYEFGKEKVTNIMYGLTIAALVGLILLVVLMVTSIEVDDYIKYLIIMALISFGVIPLVLLILENILSIICIIVLVGVLIVVIGFGLLGGSNGDYKTVVEDDYEYLTEKININSSSRGWKEQKLLQDLEYAQEQYKRCIESAETNRAASSSDYKSALNGGTIFSSSEKKMEDARKHAMHATYDEKDAAYYREQIVKLKRKLM